jgi:phage regulator Rha-like protein
MTAIMVFSAPNLRHGEPFTTSKTISEFSGVSHKYIKKQITTHKTGFKSLGLLGAYATESTGGRPEKVYRLNEPQASFLMTLLKNTPAVVSFKLELIRQFYTMRAILQKQQIAKMERKPIRRELTDVIQADPNHDKHDFCNLTNLAYRAVIGKTAAQIRREHSAPHRAVASNYMSAEEIYRVTKLESQIAVLKEMGMTYSEIKDTIEQHVKRLLSA